MGTLFGITNLAKTATIMATTTYETALPPDNMVNDQGGPTTAFQTRPGGTVTGLIIDLPSGGAVRGIGLFRSNLSITANVSVAAFDALGGQPISATVFGPSPGYGQVVYVADAAADVTQVTIDIDDPANPDGFINIPLLWIGDFWAPTTGIMPASDVGFEPAISKRRSRSGARFETQLYNPRTFGFQFGAVAEADVWPYVGEIQRTASMGRNMLLIPDDTAAEINREAVFGIVTETGRMSWPENSVSIRRWSGKIEERL